MKESSSAGYGYFDTKRSHVGSSPAAVYGVVQLAEQSALKTPYSVFSAFLLVIENPAAVCAASGIFRFKEEIIKGAEHLSGKTFAPPLGFQGNSLFFIILTIETGVPRFHSFLHPSNSKPYL